MPAVANEAVKLPTFATTQRPGANGGEVSGLQFDEDQIGWQQNIDDDRFVSRDAEL
jgi:hypothetical protein